MVTVLIYFGRMSKKISWLLVCTYKQKYPDRRPSSTCALEKLLAWSKQMGNVHYKVLVQRKEVRSEETEFMVM